MCACVGVVCRGRDWGTRQCVGGRSWPSGRGDARPPSNAGGASRAWFINVGIRSISQALQSHAIAFLLGGSGGKGHKLMNVNNLHGKWTSAARLGHPCCRNLQQRDPITTSGQYAPPPQQRSAAPSLRSGRRLPARRRCRPSGLLRRLLPQWPAPLLTCPLEGLETRLAAGMWHVHERQ